MLLFIVKILKQKSLLGLLLFLCFLSDQAVIFGMDPSEITEPSDMPIPPVEKPDFARPGGFLPDFIKNLYPKIPSGRTETAHAQDFVPPTLPSGQREETKSPKKEVTDVVDSDSEKIVTAETTPIDDELKNINETITEELKKYDLKYLDEKDLAGKNIVKKFLDYFIKDPLFIKKYRSIGYVLSVHDINLVACCCPNMTIANRLLLTLNQLNAINQKHQNKTDLFVHASIGAGKLFQAYLLAYGLLITGYKNITICCIDDYSEHNGFDFKQAQASFTNLAKKYPRASINLIEFKNVNSYIDAANKTVGSHGYAPKAHSFDSIDPNSGNPSFIQGKLDSGKYSLIIFTREADHETLAKVYTIIDPETHEEKKFRAPKRLDIFYFYLENMYDQSTKRWSTRPYFFKNDLYIVTDSEKKQLEATLKELKELEEKTYDNIETLLKEAGPIVDSFDSTLNPNTFFYQPLDFKTLVEYSRIDDTPIIFEGDTNLLAQENPQRIWYHTLDFLRTKYNPRGAWRSVMDPMGEIGGSIDYETKSSSPIQIGLKFARPYLLDKK